MIAVNAISSISIKMSRKSIAEYGRVYSVRSTPWIGFERAWRIFGTIAHIYTAICTNSNPEKVMGRKVEQLGGRSIDPTLVLIHSYERIILGWYIYDVFHCAKVWK